MSIADVAENKSSAPAIDYPAVSLISFGHTFNDLSGNFMTSLTPYLVLRGEISLTLAGFVLLVYLIASSILQPIFGLLSDRTGRRIFVVASPLWVGTAAALFGLAGNAGILLILVAIGGVGSAAFHPQAASMVDGLSKLRKGWTMSLFSMGGNIGFALGPVAAAVAALVGLHWSLVYVLPAICLSLLLFLRAPAPPVANQLFSFKDLSRAVRKARRGLGGVVGVIALRSGAQFALILLLPLYMHARGFSPQLGSYYAFVLSVAGAGGGLLGGRLSDRYGRRIVVVGSLLLSAPLLGLVLVTSSWLVWPLLVFAGVALLASNSVTVVQGQELLPASTGIASGLTLGFAFGLAGVLTTALTSMSAHTGVGTAIAVVPALPVIAALFALFVPETARRMGALQTEHDV
ncbi:MAG: MFS transporter [Chloroflexota bacterium]